MSKVTYVGELNVTAVTEILLHAEAWLAEHGELVSEEEVREIVQRYEEPVEDALEVVS